MKQVFSILAAMLVAGCAVSIENPDGSVRVIGVVDMTVAPPPGNVAGEVVRVQSIGLTGSWGRNRASVTLGYSDIRIASFKNNILAIGPFLLE